MNDKVDVLHAGKHENWNKLEQITTNWNYDFDGDGQGFPKFPKKQVCNFFTISQKRS